MTYRIRKNSLRQDLYLDRQGNWVPWKRAAKFTSIPALERFAAKHGIAVYGIF